MRRLIPALFFGGSMACFSPIKGYQLPDGTFTINRYKMKGYDPDPLTVPCGQCVGCRLERSRQWAVRCMHESSLHSANCFITLTYNDLHLPEDRSLHYEHFQDFMKRLKSKVRRKFGKTCANAIRFYMCGEYGEDFGRPHFHACIFGFQFPDLKVWSKSPSGAIIYRSKFLEELWPFGYSSVGELNFQSAAYVARYVMKKVTGKPATAHYMYINPATGEIFNRKPEFNKMSLKPGIGAAWYKKYTDDVYPHDYVVVNGKKAKPPRYYDKLFASDFPYDWESVQHVRYLDSQNRLDDNTEDRLKVKLQVAQDRLAKLKRKL